MFGIRFIRSQPTTHLMQFRGGRLAPLALAAAVGRPATGPGWQPTAWDAPALTFAVREPFPTRQCQATLVYGGITRAQPLRLRSRMPDHGVIFSDGMESDFVRFTAGVEATISVATTVGRLVC